MTAQTNVSKMLWETFIDTKTSGQMHKKFPGIPEILADISGKPGNLGIWGYFADISGQPGNFGQIEPWFWCLSAPHSAARATWIDVESNKKLAGIHATPLFSKRYVEASRNHLRISGSHTDTTELPFGVTINCPRCIISQCRSFGCLAIEFIDIELQLNFSHVSAGAPVYILLRLCTATLSAYADTCLRVEKKKFALQW